MVGAGREGRRRRFMGLMKRGGCVPNEYLFGFLVRGLRRLGDEEGAKMVERDYEEWDVNGKWGEVEEGEEEIGVVESRVSASDRWRWVKISSLFLKTRAEKRLLGSFALRDDDNALGSPVMVDNGHLRISWNQYALDFNVNMGNIIKEEAAKGLNPGVIVLIVVVGLVLLFLLGNYALYVYAQKTLPPKKKKPVSKKKMKRERLKQGVSAPGE
ncbi:uncharacterized protein A4U43_C05F5390 [Asparagus officinalis]|uniref:Uncharacterized protein n=1 Tax=Asparagus officinalis TaxID=4686 RepID=A0A5P1EPJ3_ASPOF|nr:uncharacterized protein A4U43_C05F5390 [Asparagus officinalis]